MRRSPKRYQPGAARSRRHRSRKSSAAPALIIGALAALSLSGCSSNVIKHGHYFTESDIQQIQPGMSQEQVRLTLGTPTTTASVGTGNAYYYISSTATQAAFFKEQEVDRKVAAIYFNQLGLVERVANYGLKDGKVFDFISRKTPAPGGKDEGLLNQLFRNLGKGQQKIFDPGQF